MNAARSGHGDIVTYLVEQGANKDLKDNVSIHLLRMIMIIMMMMMIVYAFVMYMYVCMSMYI